MKNIVLIQEHINNGKPINPKKCPVALALTDAGFKNVSVGATRVHFSTFWGTRSVDLPEEVIGFIRTFDCYPKDAKPFEFKI